MARLPAKLPTRESLGPLPARGRPMLARVDLPRTSPGEVIGQGVAQFGRGIAKIGEAAEAIEDNETKRLAFETERSFQEFEWNQKLALDQNMRQVKPGEAREFPDAATKGYVDSAKEFYKGVPEQLKPFYEQKLLRAERDIYGTAATFARNEQKRFSVSSLNDSVENIYRPKARITPTNDLDSVTGDYERLVRSNPDLTPIEAEELIKRGRRAIGLSHVDSLPPDMVRRPSGTAEAAGLLRKFEGFRDSAYWDVNAFRVGFGSDTVTRADGTIERVTKDTRVTREDAERDLARRTQEFAGTAQRQVGEGWAGLPDNVKAALTSVAYNYGSLPKSVAAAAQSGNVQQIAESVRNLSANRGRRAQEADIILGGSGQPAALAALTDEDWRQAEGSANTRRTRQATAVAETFERHIIEAQAGRGSLPDRSSIEFDPNLDEPRRNTLLRQFDAANSQVVAFQQLNQRFNDPSSGPFNPFDANDRKGVDAIYQHLGADQTALTAVVNRTGMVPTSVATKLRGDLVSNNPQRVEASLQMVSNLTARNPAIFSGVTGHKELDDAATDFRHRVENLGMTAKEAAQKYVESQTPEYKAKVAARIKNEDINEVAKKNLNINDLRTAFDASWWPGSPNIAFEPETRKAMFSDYESLFRERYLETGDVSQSKALAQKQLKRVWGVSNINGSQVVMRYPPESAPAFHGVEDVSTKIADQVIQAIRLETGTPARSEFDSGGGKVVTRNQIRLMPVAGYTADAYFRGEPPPYLVTWQDKDGTVHTLNPGRAFVADPKIMRTAQTALRETAFTAEREYRDIARQPMPPIMRKEQKAVERRRLRIAPDMASLPRATEFDENE